MSRATASEICHGMRTFETTVADHPPEAEGLVRRMTGRVAWPADEQQQRSLRAAAYPTQPSTGDNLAQGNCADMSVWMKILAGVELSAGDSQDEVERQLSRLKELMRPHVGKLFPKTLREYLGGSEDVVQVGDDERVVRTMEEYVDAFFEVGFWFKRRDVQVLVDFVGRFRLFVFQAADLDEDTDWIDTTCLHPNPHTFTPEERREIDQGLPPLSLDPHQSRNIFILQRMAHFRPSLDQIPNRKTGRMETPWGGQPGIRWAARTKFFEGINYDELEDGTGAIPLPQPTYGWFLPEKKDSMDECEAGEEEEEEEEEDHLGFGDDFGFNENEEVLDEKALAMEKVRKEIFKDIDSGRTSRPTGILSTSGDAVSEKHTMPPRPSPATDSSNSAPRTPARRPTETLQLVKLVFGFMNSSRICWLNSLAVALGVNPRFYRLVTSSDHPACQSFRTLYSLPRSLDGSVTCANAVLPFGCIERETVSSDADPVDAIQRLLRLASQAAKTEVEVVVSRLCKGCRADLSTTSTAISLVSNDDSGTLDIARMFENALLKPLGEDHGRCTGEPELRAVTYPNTLILINEQLKKKLILDLFELSFGDLHVTYQPTAVILCLDGHFITIVLIGERWYKIDDIGNQHVFTFEKNSTLQARMIFAVRVDAPSGGVLDVAGLSSLAPVSIAPRGMSHQAGPSHSASASQQTVPRFVDSNDAAFRLVSDVHLDRSESLSSTPASSSVTRTSTWETREGLEGLDRGDILEDDLARRQIEERKRRGEMDQVESNVKERSEEDAAMADATDESRDEEMAFADNSFNLEPAQTQSSASVPAPALSFQAQAVSNTSTQAFTVPLPARPPVLPKVKYRGTLRNPTSVKVERKRKGKETAKATGEGKEEEGEGEPFGDAATTWKGVRAREVLKPSYSYEECKNSRLVDAVGTCLRSMEMDPVLASNNEANKARQWRKIWWLKVVIQFLISAKEVIKTREQLKVLVGRLPKQAGTDWPWNVKQMLLGGEAIKQARRIDANGKLSELQKVAALPGVSRFAICEMRLKHAVTDLASFFRSSEVGDAQRRWNESKTQDFVTNAQAVELVKRISKCMDAELEGLRPLALLVGSLGGGRLDSHDLDILLAWVGGDPRQITKLLLTLEREGVIDVIYSFSAPSQERVDPLGRTFALYKSCYFVQVGFRVQGQRYLGDVFICLNGEWIVPNLLLRSSESVVKALQEVALDCGYVLTFEGLFTRAAWLSNGEPVKIESEEEVFDRLRLKWRPSTSRRADAAKDGRRYEGGARK